MTELSDENRQNLRARFISDISTLERALLRYSPQPAEEVNSASRLLTGLLNGAMEGDAFIANIYRLAHHIPLELN